MRLNICGRFLDERLAEGLGGTVAVRTDDARMTYDGVVERSSRYASLFAADDIRPEERVIIALPDTEEYPCVLFGVLRRGAVAVMVNPDASADLLRYFFEYTRATAVVTSAAHLEAIAHATAGLTVRHYCVGRGELEGRLRQEASVVSPFDSHADDPAIWLFSGGTTGYPKAVIQTHRSFANTTERYGHGVLGMRADDITISVPKLFFGYATGSNLFFPFSVGASCVLFPERCTADVLFAKIRRHRPTVLVNVPAMIQQLLAHEDAAKQDLSSLRFATSAGEALPADLYDRWKSTFGVELVDGLGTAEMWHIFLSNRPGDVVPGTLGRPVPGFDIRLCDAEGVEVPNGTAGELWVRGGSRAIAYWQRMEDTMHAFRGEWYVSGDMLRRNPDGTFTYCGRSDDMLKVNGKWVAPSEVENCLRAHPAVREAVVVGVANTDGLVKPRAYVVSDQASDELGRELQEHVESCLERFKCPREIVFLESLPRTHLGKVDRAILGKRLTHPIPPHA